MLCNNGVTGRLLSAETIAEAEFTFSFAALSMPDGHLFPFFTSAQNDTVPNHFVWQGGILRVKTPSTNVAQASTVGYLSRWQTTLCFFWTLN